MINNFKRLKKLKTLLTSVCLVTSLNLFVEDEAMGMDKTIVGEYKFGDETINFVNKTVNNVFDRHVQKACEKNGKSY